MIELKDLKHVAPKGQGYFCIVKQYVNAEGKNFALKELKKEHYTNEEYRYRLLREINMLKTLQGCNNIIRLVNHGNSADDHSMWYLMPYARYNLYEYIKKYNQGISQDTRFEIVEQIINAIKYAHDRDILHRDISPNNILVFFKGGKETIKVTDFGLGKTTESMSNYTGSSASNYGQILYVSPEQRKKLKDSSVQSDIFSLGKLIYFVFTGKDPDNIKVFELSSLVTKAIDENPMNRFNNMDELKERFDALKNLYVDKDSPIEYITLEEYLKSGEELEYTKFHTILVNGKYITHPYHDYISEVNSYFLTSGNLE
ncbi:MAG: serine/threonine-protein kinase, partial [Bacteroidia bacterium]|nr:serine/threonine-protein kinase [Bacteroidia bacterium]